jgi:TRAP-type C4-dicarboxylate transport system permease small subunit
MIDRLDRMMAWTCTALVYVATAAGAGLTAFVALAAVMRYLVGAPFHFTEEIVGLLFATMVFLALPYCTYFGRHIHVTLVSERLPARWQPLRAAVAQLLVISFCAYYLVYAWEFVALSWRLRSRSDIAGFTLWPWMAVILLGCVLMALATLLRLRRPREGGGSGEGSGGA